MKVVQVRQKKESKYKVLTDDKSESKNNISSGLSILIYNVTNCELS